jgi:hypothetical protein
MDTLIYIVVIEYYVSNKRIIVIRDNTGETLYEISHTKKLERLWRKWKDARY